MKEFDIEAAKSGAPIQTRDGLPARIICWDKKGTNYPIVALVEFGELEEDVSYDRNGALCTGANSPLASLWLPLRRKAG